MGTFCNRRLLSGRLHRDAVVEPRGRAVDRLARAHVLAGPRPLDPVEDPFRIRRRASGRAGPPLASSDAGAVGDDDAGGAGEVSGRDAWALRRLWTPSS